ncbi:uncharacterized protein BO97DRAFT_450383 [Aspergillus homomorphus CBS 101889]|uniref:Rhodopsin domain-containing protein n=1 Tax=Aspergillus homomorphus (strain CBS 101889) TaxID=1450537 RepID=A0A395HZS5_ASPHC|nr:hypothetical protein BO97DRAFT_450383 [Aspergillus homomorphus CBS 101889]RAL13056.1 hypothetical protein BO97DRAFT_450383 [Aspergillus homomorphus CBS 101889]
MALNDTGVTAPPAGVTPDFTHPAQYLHTTNRVVVIVGIAVSSVCLLVRIYSRVMVVRKWMLDDNGYTHAGLGIHAWDLTIEEYNRSLKALMAGAVMYIPALGLSKIGLIILYYRLSDMQRSWRIILWSFTMFVITYMIVLECLFLFGCNPIPKAWDVTVEGQCISRASVFLAGTCASITIDIVLVVTPLPVVVGLNMVRKKRVGVACMFGLGGLSLITSCIRLASVVPMLHTNDESYQLGSIVLWINVEATIIIVTACVPSFRQVFLGSWGSSGSRERALSSFSLRSGPRRHQGFTNLTVDLDPDPPDSVEHVAPGKAGQDPRP